MKNTAILLLLTMLLGFFSHKVQAQAQGLINDGANIVLANGVVIVITDNVNGNYVAKNDGKIKSQSPTSSTGTIKVAANWINNNPNNFGFDNDGVTVELNGGNQNITGTHSTVFYNLVLSGTGTKSLGLDTKVGGETLLTGVLNLNNIPLALNENTLEITNGAINAISTDGISGRIISEHLAAENKSIVKWNTNSTGNYVYPFGTDNNSDNYIPFTVNKISTGNNSISISTRRTVSSDNQPWEANVTHFKSETYGPDDDYSKDLVIDRWYDFSPTAPLDATITLAYRGEENTTTPTGGVNTGAFSVFQWSGMGWKSQGGGDAGVTSGVGYVTASGVNSFGTFVVSSQDFPLPVKLSQFSASCPNNSSQISWITESELNSDYFLLEASRNGFNWTVLDKVEAAGNSSTKKEYSFEDINTIAGANYYRLRQVDYDGKENIYGPISTACHETNDISMSIYPNPAKDQFTISITSPQQTEATIQLIESTGKVVEQRDYFFKEGNNQFLFNSCFYAKGTYTIYVISDLEIKTKKIVLF